MCSAERWSQRLHGDFKTGKQATKQEVHTTCHACIFLMHALYITPRRYVQLTSVSCVIAVQQPTADGATADLQALLWTTADRTAVLAKMQTRHTGTNLNATT